MNYRQLPFQGSFDRSEPPIGAQMLLKVHALAPNETASLVGMLIDPLVAWSNWTWARRRCAGSLAPAGGVTDLICLGTDVPTAIPSDSSAGTASGARLESGQDNSPEFSLLSEGGPVGFDNATGHLELYTVMITSLALAEAQALIALAAIANRTDVATLMQSRAAALAAAISASLWDDIGGLGQGAFSNRLFNGTFFRRYSPTTFFPLIAGAASDAQVERMLPLLTSPAGFCVNASHRGPPGTTPGVHYVSHATNTSLLCATQACINTALDRGDFYYSRLEFLPTAASTPNTSGLVPIYTHYNAALSAFAASIGNATPPAGYELVRTEAFCSASPAGGLVPVTLWTGGANGSAPPHSYVLCGTGACEREAAAAGLAANGTSCFAANASGPTNAPCMYGVPPLLSRSDPAFCDGETCGAGEYWLGRAWGPHAALIYMALQAYDHLPAARAARLTLVEESRALFLRDWRVLRHSNENANVLTGTGSDNGSADTMYTWGLLWGHLSIVEAGVGASGRA